MQEKSKWEVSIKSLSSEFRKPCRRGGRWNIRARGDAGYKRTRLSESTKHDTHELTETEAASTWLHK
ncbi:hypothetical protein ACQP3C_25580, partial [Escherichia coli]